ncbi:hypothetical protein BDV93DRAFT_604408 [Ceratobasidium sp. AG-I]|nr:hypothetical protein BDV93DRAFT_604408 [Ceratobasidium sp. AG-I]
MNMTPLTPPPALGQYASSECYEKIDALVDNVSVGDLRVIISELLKSSDVSTSERFCHAAQLHLLQTSPKPLPAPNSLLLFERSELDPGSFGNRGDTQPSPLLYSLASRTRMLYASGLLREAIRTILCIVQTGMCPGARWSEGNDLAELYRRIDEDIVCVIRMAMDHVQGLRQAMSALRTPTPTLSRGTRELSRSSKSLKRRDDGESAEGYLELIIDLGAELTKIQTTVVQWDGVFPFKKGMSAFALAVSRA